MSETSFDVIPFEDIKGSWRKLGSGSFGNVYKGNYLGIDVAIKEVLPSTDYDVAKYFEREWRLMKECRHPNVVLYLGLSRAPDGRIFIISEYIENGNLRIWIHDKSKPFPWSLKLSFATDICRALAYLHARKCIHRDLKGENLLLTSNLRVKITDFGFARIAARNDSELKRLTFCGTDAYMSPEILNGTPFDLSTDIFSLGVILAEIGARHLADEKTFARSPPGFSLDPEEIRKKVGGVKGVPSDYLQLVLDCLQEDATVRPSVKDVLERLRVMETEVATRIADADEAGGDMHVGSVKFVATRGRKQSAAPRIPSFSLGAGQANESPGVNDVRDEDDGNSSDEELAQAVLKLNSVDFGENVWGAVGNSTQPLIPSASSIATGSPTATSSYVPSEYSTTVIRGPPPPTLSQASILTIRPNDGNSSSPEQPGPTESMLTIDSYHTATESSVSIAGATEGSFMTVEVTETTPSPEHQAKSQTIHLPAPQRPVPPTPSQAENGRVVNNHDTKQRVPAPMFHRFTIIKPGSKSPGTRSRANSPTRSGPFADVSIGKPTGGATGGTIPAQLGGGWSPFHLFFASGLLVARCDLCGQRLGWKPVLECDDCGLRTHLKCGDNAPRDCGLRPVARR